MKKVIAMNGREEQMDDLIKRQDAITAYCEHECGIKGMSRENCGATDCGTIFDDISSAHRWIPCSERLPENTEPVNITWVNRKPEPYYADIKDKPFTATGHYHNGKWWWYSAVCQDYLDEYGKCEMDEMDGDIEVTAWMPLPEPYKGEET